MLIKALQSFDGGLSGGPIRFLSSAIIRAASCTALRVVCESVGTDTLRGCTVGVFDISALPQFDRPVNAGSAFVSDEECFRLIAAQRFQRHFPNLIGGLRDWWVGFHGGIVRFIRWLSSGENVDGVGCYYLSDFASDKFHCKHILLLFSSSSGFSALAESCFNATDGQSLEPFSVCRNMPPLMEYTGVPQFAQPFGVASAFINSFLFCSGGRAPGHALRVRLSPCHP
jgi:hypothetical protein